ncbi:DUF4652 domain-containing protein [Cytobacillus oceanisediminis]|uniref:DUF4652 domain-containing protein n=1 Tax=Cytobacillus oceanisediminis TaxID=665099 RepID=UPI00207A81F7|nr:DUF4652 domain-containing protein [Cytobacillus oceanisediminis]USK46359.1 DUF4652 domain-containing protein [Cytobacillus oceanisediminis]
MYQLLYDETKNEIYQIDPNGNKTTITDDFPSKPDFSPNNKMAIYISPLEWECSGSLYLYNLENGYITEIVSPDENDYIPKFAKWLDNQNIAVIIGYGAGMVAVGGNVFIYNIKDRSLKQLTNYPSEIQITQLSKKYSALELQGIKYIDDNHSRFEGFKEKIAL